MLAIGLRNPITIYSRKFNYIFYLRLGQIVIMEIILMHTAIILQSNVQREKHKKPDPPCVVCGGSGRVDCHNCQGRGFLSSSAPTS